MAVPPSLGGKWDSQDLVTTRQVADYLHVHIRTVQGWARDGRLPSMRVGGRLRFRREDVEDFLNNDPDSEAR